MDSNTIGQEAIAFPTGPSQAITYQIGRRQTDLRLLYFQTHCFIFGDVTAAVSSRGQTVTQAQIRARHDLTEQSRPERINDGQTIRVVPLPSKRRRRRS
jgi:hypothetical protein